MKNGIRRVDFIGRWIDFDHILAVSDAQLMELRGWYVRFEINMMFLNEPLSFNWSVDCWPDLVKFENDHRWLLRDDDQWEKESELMSRGSHTNLRVIQVVQSLIDQHILEPWQKIKKKGN